MSQLEILTENPGQWLATSKFTSEIQKKELKPYILLALKELEGCPDKRISNLVSVEKYAAIRSVVRHMSRCRNFNKEAYNEDNVSMFLEGLGFTQECVKELSSIFCSDQIYESLPKHIFLKPQLEKMDWKIDLSLCNLQDRTEQNRQDMHNKTSILLTFFLSNGHILNYRLTIVQFHQLRYVIASALKSMILLERRKCMKVA